MKGLMWFLLIFYLYSYGAQGEDKCKNKNRNSDEKRLRDDLFKDVASTSSPVKDYNKKINVTLQLLSSRINYRENVGLGDVGYIIMDMKYFMAWSLPCTTWDPSKYGGISILDSVYYNVWSPEFVNEHEFTDDNSFKINMLNDVCSMADKGVVFCTFIDYVQFPCRVASKRLWPFETNKCELKMMSDPVTKQAVDLQIVIFKNAFKESLSSGDWEISSMKTRLYKPSKSISTLVKLRNNNTGFILEINMKRNYQIISSYIVYPFVVIMVLTISSLSLHIGSITKVLLATASLGYHFKINSLLTIELPKSVAEPPLIGTVNTRMKSVALFS